MTKSKKIIFNKTEESIFTLFTLAISINQTFESITGNEDIMYSNFDFETSNFKDLANDTIYEALYYQILLKTCAYIDEWNNIFGVKTEEVDKTTIINVKKIARPAYKNISDWKHLKIFRNQVIAHNHRDNYGNNIYINQIQYHSPQTISEIYLLVLSLTKMMDLVHLFFPRVAEKSAKMIKQNMKSQYKPLTKKEILNKINQTKSIDNFIADYILRNKVFSAIVGKVMIDKKLLSPQKVLG